MSLLLNKPNLGNERDSMKRKLTLSENASNLLINLLKDTTVPANSPTAVESVEAVQEIMSQLTSEAPVTVKE